eukprot:14688115-Alexandrium_andersonii.AAC.1
MARQRAATTAPRIGERGTIGGTKLQTWTATMMLHLAQHIQSTNMALGDSNSSLCSLPLELAGSRSRARRAVASS